MNMHPNDQLQQLSNKQCMQCRKGDLTLSKDKINGLLSVLPHWELIDHHAIQRKWSFANFTETISFIKEIAEIATSNDHHPDVSFGYNYCTVLYSTHAINGLSENDFICAAQIELIATEK